MPGPWSSGIINAPARWEREWGGGLESNFPLSSDKVVSLFAPSTCTARRHDLVLNRRV